MSQVYLDDSYLSEIASAIRTKKGVETQYKPTEMAAAIESITTGANWGEIGGTLSDQTDLQSALDLKENADNTILKQANVINNVTTESTIYPLSATQGKVLQTEINNLKNIGRFLAILDASAGTVSSQPSGSVGDTYDYKVGDYYRVGAAGNYTPKGTATYTIDATSGSSNFESGETSYGIGDVIYCSNLTSTTSTWVKQQASGGGTVQDVQVNGTTILNGGIANLTASNVPSIPLAKISDVTASATELNYVDGVTSPIQTQINNKIIYSVDTPAGQSLNDYWIEDITDYKGLTFTANTAGSTVTLGKSGSPAWTGSYSLDNGTTWTAYVPGTTGAITLTNIGDKVCFRGDITANFSTSNYIQFSMTGSIAASGNCNSIYFSNNFNNLTTLTYQFCYYKLFSGCSQLTNAPSLPATTLSSGCYVSMFNNCTSLLTPPSLIANSIASYCYQGMFFGCSSLRSVPALPASTLYDYCYNQMFWGCTSLQVNDAPVSGIAEKVWVIPTTNTFTYSGTQTSMFYDCAGTRSSNNLSYTQGQSNTYYTQNEPI